MKGMKGVVITFMVVLGLGMYLLMNYGTVARKAMAEVAVEEGGQEGVDAAMAKADDAAFVAKYRPLLEKRWFFAAIAKVLDEDFFLEDSKDAVNLYNETPLDHDETYGKFLFERGMVLTTRMTGDARQEAYTLFGRYMQNFPNGNKFHQSDNARTQLTVKYGVQ